MTLDVIDPFHGCAAIDLPEPQGLAATWPFLKAQTGNTHPGACLPFGMVSVCPYSGAYPTGYGLNDFNYHGTVPRLFDEYTATGFTHCHQSGTGAIGAYYNFVRVFPFRGKMGRVDRRWRLTEEEARPGRYAATLADIDVRVELVAVPGGARHRYRFLGGSGAAQTAGLGFDLANHGIIGEDGTGESPVSYRVDLRDDGTFAADLVVSGIDMYVCGSVAPTGSETRVWIDGQQHAARSHHGDATAPFGVLYEWRNHPTRSVDAAVAISFRSREHARERLAAILGRSFQESVAAAELSWRSYFDAVEVETEDAELRGVFASCLYRSLVKPCDLTGESPFWSDDESCYVDFATMWDQYKTHLPLILTLYPEAGAGIVRSLIRYGEEAGRFPIAVLLRDSLDDFRNQARSLGAYTIADAWHRRIGGIDWHRALNAIIADLRHPANDDFRSGGKLARFTHGLDLAGAADAAARLAAGIGRHADGERMTRLSTQWRRFYDEDTGILGHAEYYEGTAWNYSFRLLHDMAERIELCGGPKAFVSLLDRFFGFGAGPVPRAFAPSDSEALDALYRLHRFCGYNNEPDIEAPYAYLYAGRHDRTAEIVRAVLRYNYSTGRGGLPGNDDSGGLASAFVWNALGLFPVSGQPMVLIGSPCFRRASLRMGDSTLTIRASEASTENIHVKSATLNGKELDRAWLTVDELLGRANDASPGHRPGDVELTFEMSAKPGGFGARIVP